MKFNESMDRYRDRLFNSAPRCVDVRMLDKMARRTIADDGNLLRCSWASLACAITDAATLGLSIGKGVTANAYIIPFKDHKKNIVEAQLVIGYKGMIDLARRSGQLQHIAFDVVREGDHFHYASGLKVECDHKPSTDPGRGKKPITHAYCCGSLVGGGSFVVVMPWSEIEAHRDRYAKGKDKDDSPWKTNPDVMAMKTAVRKAFNRRYLPMGVEDYRLLEKAFEREDVIEGTYSFPEDPEPLTSIDHTPGAQTETAQITEREPGDEPLTEEQEFAQALAEENAKS